MYMAYQTIRQKVIVVLAAIQIYIDYHHLMFSQALYQKITKYIYNDKQSTCKRNAKIQEKCLYVYCFQLIHCFHFNQLKF